MATSSRVSLFFFQAEDGIRDVAVTGVQTCALPICLNEAARRRTLRVRRTEELWLTAEVGCRVISAAGERSNVRRSLRPQCPLGLSDIRLRIRRCSVPKC